jgi:hypothetical protein
MEVAITLQRLRWVAKRGKGALREAAEAVAHVLADPKAIYEGVRWDCDSDKESDSDDWLCYSGIPKEAFATDGRPHAPYEGEVLLVFVNSDGVAYLWRWDECDDDDTTAPRDWRTRFCKKVWPK